jgi:hypothetical protein
MKNSMAAIRRSGRYATWLWLSTIVVAAAWTASASPALVRTELIAMEDETRISFVNNWDGNQFV